MFAGGAIELFWLMLSSHFRRRQFYATIRDCYLRCVGIPYTAGIQLQMDGKVCDLPKMKVFEADEFIREFQDQYGLRRIGDQYRV